MGAWRTIRRPAAALLLIPALAAATASAQSTETQVTVTHTGYTMGGNPIPPGIFLQCRGTPTCTSQIQQTISIPECPGASVVYLNTTMTGVNLASSSLQGSIVMQVAVPSCTLIGTINFNYTYSASWSPSAGSGAITIDGPTCSVQGVDACSTLRTTIQGTIRTQSVPAPVFPLSVTASITPVTATASATLQYRPQDLGSSGGVFVFAAAPATVVQGSESPLAMRLGKADASSCVLAQLDGTGKLVAVTNGQFQAAISGVLSAQGATVNVMNNVSTPKVAGATFYVGYGASGPAMLDGGVFRNAVLVPGSGVCPMLPYATALWWNPDESGWGLNLNQQGNTVFGTLFTYDGGRAPSWFVMSGGTLQSDGLTFTGDLFRTTGPAFNANPFTPIGPSNVTKVGTMSIAFSHANAATLTYSVNGATVTKAIQRQVFGSRSANCLPSSSSSRASSGQYQDLWWNEAESGWGLNLTHQDSTLFGTLFTYDAGGRDLWLVMSAGTRQGDGSFVGDLFRTSGSPFNAATVSPPDVSNVGTMQLRFSDGDHGTLTYTYSGASVTKAITRQLFSAPASSCN